MGEIDRLSQIVDELLILSRAGEHELPGERRRPRRRGRARGRALARRRPRSGLSSSSCASGGGPADGLVRRAPTSTARSTPWSRTRSRYSPAGSTVTIASRRRVGSRSSTDGPGLAAGRGGGGLRALQPRQRRPARARGDRPRPADRPRADPSVGRRGAPRATAKAAACAATIELARPEAAREPAAQPPSGSPWPCRPGDRDRRGDRRRQPDQPADRHRLANRSPPATPSPPPCAPPKNAPTPANPGRGKTAPREARRPPPDEPTSPGKNSAPREESGGDDYGGEEGGDD